VRRYPAHVLKGGVAMRRSWPIIEIMFGGSLAIIAMILLMI
jgi:hypothetical protein